MRILTEHRDATRLSRNQIAQAVFALAENRAISDRRRVERLIDQVILRLEREGRPVAPTLPGMEDLVGRDRSLSPGEVQAIAEQILVSWSRPQAAPGPEPPELTPTPALPRQRGREQEGVAVIAPTKYTLSNPSQNALTILERRYLRKDEHGRVVETPAELCRRVARNIASAELNHGSEADADAWEERFFGLMDSLDFLPNSPTLMNAGTALQQLSACFVLPVGDSLPEIFDAVKNTALIHQSGGGTGFSFSRLRPEGDVVRSTGGVASGPVTFMRVFDAGTDVIKQGGRRRGANMGVLSVDHPDILKFIAAKEQEDAFNNFNISVAVTEEFMEAVQADRDYDLINPRSGQAVGTLNAKEVFERIVDGAWRNGEPGIVFMDRINQANPTPHLGKIESTNPCGEQPLLPYESCNLGSINLAHMLADVAGEPAVDWERLEKTVHWAVRFLDDVIDVNHFPLPQIDEMTKRNRKIGLGIMGFADMLIQLGISYDSQEAVEMAENVMGFIEAEATKASEALAADRGVFPAFEGSIYDKPDMPRVRNATRTTIAPTGTISIISGCSSGIEPLFALAYTRQTRLPEAEGTDMRFVTLTEVNPPFEALARREGFYSEELMAELTLRGSVNDIDQDVPAWVKQLFVTAHDIAPGWHVRLQASFQRHVDNAVSKTINFPHDATRDDVAQAYFLAWEMGCKGITIYRDRSRQEQVLTVQGEEQAPGPSTDVIPRPRPTVTTGSTAKVATGCGNLYVTINSDETGMCELFSTLGKAGGCAAAQSEAISRLISLALRSGVQAETIVEQLLGIRCPSIAWDDGHAVLSCPDAIASVLERQLVRGSDSPRPTVAEPAAAGPTPREAGDSYGGAAIEEPAERVVNLGGQCPDCSSLLIYQEGCFICRHCGYTKCG